MKKYRVTLYVGDDKQWVFAYGRDKHEAMEDAMNNISIVECEEVKEDDEY